MSVARFLSVFFFAVTCLQHCSQPLFADVYIVQSLDEVKILEGDWPVEGEGSQNISRYWWRWGVVQPYGVLDGEGEIYLTHSNGPWNGPWDSRGRARTYNPTLAIRLSEARQITGRLFLPKPDFSGMQVLKFSIPAEKGHEENRDDFLNTKLAHYQQLLNSDRTGSAWFRHQVRNTRKELGISSETTNEQRRNVFRNNRSSMERSYALVSGGRAISENLQLDRLLPQAKAEPPTISLDSIKGITIQAFDWKEMIEDAQPERDPLAKLIPNDQYAIFLHSFQALVDLADNAGEQGALALRAAEPRAEEALVRQRYERQLGIGMTKLARQLGPALIESVALTGADPYLRTGADLAILFEAKNVDALHGLLKTQLALTAGTQSGAKPIAGDILSVRYEGFRSPDRSICTYLATLGNVVVVTNSPAQLQQLVRVHQGQLASLDSLEEYTFFRNRYPRGDEQETGLLILSDNTIRKWCGPRWRIATSRRTRAAALMAELQASHADRLVAGKVTPGPLHTDLSVPDAGDFTLRPTGVSSSVYGSLEFLSPIIELEFTKVTKEEQGFYERWRQGYERNWSNFFDPIAVQFKTSEELIGIDLTVMPLIASSEYNQFINVSQGATIKEHSGDPHEESLVHAVLSLNTESSLLNAGASFAMTMAQVNPLSWIGESIALYVDNDPLWAECAAIEDEEQLEDFMEQNVSRLPIALNIEVKSSFKLIAFLTGLRTFIEQSAPGMTTWETLKHNEQSYVKVSPAERAKSGRNGWDDASLYYVAGSENLVLTLSEDLLKRAIDRQADRKEKHEAGEPLPQATMPWLGENLCVTADARLMHLLYKALRSTYHDQMQRLSWGNLAILNEWHVRYPDQNAIDVHRRLWNRRLICPGGGQYRWNDTWQTMESTVYGHPGEPRFDGAQPGILQSFISGNFGQTFEENGLRVRAELKRKPDGNSKSPKDSDAQ